MILDKFKNARVITSFMKDEKLESKLEHGYGSYIPASSPLVGKTFRNAIKDFPSIKIESYYLNPSHAHVPLPVDETFLEMEIKPGFGVNLMGPMKELHRFREKYDLP